jgi:asparagine synthase (glutamine-hydrolysing)
MCGIAAVAGSRWRELVLEAMVGAQTHRGPDASGVYVSPRRAAGLGHNRLSILDLSDAGRQPMSTADGQLWLVFNGEIYNYVELKRTLDDYPYRSAADSEVILAAYQRWGLSCLDRFIGMFAFALWDEREQRLFAARDRFGVKPLVYHQRPDGTLFMASEIRALHAAGVPATADERAWATYLTHGLSDHTEGTFWSGIVSLPPGWAMTWQAGTVRRWSWYDLAARVGSEYDSRSPDEVQEEYLALLEESARLRFRADVPVGINLSGGLDSATLLGLVHRVQGDDSDVTAFTFATGDSRYDELPWVTQMLAQTSHPSVICTLEPREVPDLALSVLAHEEEPFGGLPTIAYARLFERARGCGVKVLLDGQGMDEQWAGYDYYADALGGRPAGFIQGAREQAVKPHCLVPEFRNLATPFHPPQPFSDALRNLQYRDARYTKIPRVLRFNDRASMRSSTELREPFLDHRLFELALRQPPERKIHDGTRKWLLRRVAGALVPAGVVEAPKRPVQTPQREWLAGELRDWATDLIELGLRTCGSAWMHLPLVRDEWQRYCDGDRDNSFFVWQWISIGLLASMTSASTTVGPSLRADTVIAQS